MSSMSLDQLAETVQGTVRVGDLWRVMVGFVASRGGVRVAFHVNPSPGEPLAAPAVRAEGFPEDWVAHYLAEDLVLSDPIPALAAKRSKPFFWRDVSALTRLSEGEADFLRELETAELGDGLAMQVYGPGMRSAYVGIGFGQQRPDMDAAAIFDLKAGVQIGYLRFCELTAEAFALERDLSPRETEILGWVARGKSNTVIAEILGVSRHTVDTNLRRLFSKLEVADRTTAALRGVGAGLVSIGGPPVAHVRDKT
jgi:LuxR family transcriptional regulator/LuxR family quorum-sensing system transcriptional regulator CciR